MTIYDVLIIILKNKQSGELLKKSFPDFVCRPGRCFCLTAEMSNGHLAPRKRCFVKKFRHDIKNVLLKSYPDMPENNVFGHKKNNHPIGWLLLCVGIFLFFRIVTNQVSSAPLSLTSVFGMGTGGPSTSSTPTMRTVVNRFLQKTLTDQTSRRSAPLFFEPLRKLT